MFAATLNRLTISIPDILGVGTTKKARPRGPLPTWINDRQLAEQLLKDTGLTPDDLGGGPAYDGEKPFFMQQNYW